MSLFHRLWEWLWPEKIQAVEIYDEVIEDICMLAESGHPKEMIAFLTGSVEKGTLRIDGLYVKSYYANERSTWFTLHDLPLTGVYGTVHSHPGPSNRPSLADRRLFATSGWFHLIIKEPYKPEDIAAYDKKGNRISVKVVT